MGDLTKEQESKTAVSSFERLREESDSSISCKSTEDGFKYNEDIANKSMGKMYTIKN